MEQYEKGVYQITIFMYRLKAYQCTEWYGWLVVGKLRKPIFVAESHRLKSLVLHMAKVARVGVQAQVGKMKWVYQL